MSELGEAVQVALDVLNDAGTSPMHYPWAWAIFESFFGCSTAVMQRHLAYTMQIYPISGVIWAPQPSLSSSSTNVFSKTMSGSSTQGGGDCAQSFSSSFNGSYRWAS